VEYRNPRLALEVTGAVARQRARLHCLHRLQRRLEKMVHLPVFGQAAAEDRFKIRYVGDVYDSVDAMNKGREGIVGSVAMAEQHDVLFAALGGRFTYELLKNWVISDRCAFEVFIHDNYFVRISTELQKYVVFVQSLVHVVLKINQLGSNELLVLFVINTDEGGVFASLKSSCNGLPVHNLAESVCRDIHAQT
jgi:hypothetical protein